MGLFNNLMSKIFGNSTSTSAGGTGQSTPTAAQSTQPGSPPTAAAGGGGSATTIAQQVDVAAVLDDLARKNPEKLDWKHSIVDLMKLVGMDSSLTARKQLATELHYTGDQSDTASMNIWLHKQVLRKLAENGGKVPQELLK
jgi:Domain of unknown function (DUF3597)